MSIWNTLPRNVWEIIFRENFDFETVNSISLVCKKWFSIIRSPVVGCAFLNEVGVRYVDNVCWMKTYCARPKVMIAVDCSLSMKFGVNSWRFLAAKKKAYQIFNTYRNLASKGGVTLVLFAEKTRSFVVKNNEELEANFSKQVENGNSWPIFQKMLVSFHKKRKLRSEVYILSDFISYKKELSLMVKRIMEIPFERNIHLHFMEIGGGSNPYFKNNLSVLLGKVRKTPSHVYKPSAWETLSRDLWVKIFREYFEPKELVPVSKVCTLLHTYTRIEEVAGPFLQRVGLSYSKEECWIKAFYRPRVIIAVDCSSSMFTQNEWRFELAMQKAEAIFGLHAESASKEDLDFAIFGERILRRTVVSLGEIRAFSSDQSNLDFLGNTNEWNCLTEHLLPLSESKRPHIVYVLSDFQETIVPLAEMINAIKNIVLKLNFIQVGSTWGSYFEQEAVESERKRAKTESNITFEQLTGGNFTLPDNEDEFENIGFG